MQRNRLLELLDHDLRVPVRPVIVDLAAGVLGRREGAVIDHGGKRIALGAAGEKDEMLLAGIVVGRQGRSAGDAEHERDAEGAESETHD